MVNLQKITNATKPKTIMSIDASTNSVAFALFSDDTLVKYGKINFSGATAYDKVVDASRKLRPYFSEHVEVDAIVIEHTVFMNSPKTAADLALVQGAILGAAGVPLIRSVAPITWQNFIGNKKPSKDEIAMFKNNNPGKSDSWVKAQLREQRKQKTIHFIEVQYDKVVTDNDVADAIAIGHYATKNWGKLTK
jgi:Holliday junction resolvasome RuvABC endonuclease subunit